MRSYKIAVIPGEGIGKEIVPAALKVLDEAALYNDFQIEKDQYGWGAGYYMENGIFMPENGLETLKKYDAIFFGAVCLPDVEMTAIRWASGTSNLPSDFWR